MTTRNITQRPKCHTCGRAAPYASRVNKDRRARGHIRQLEALGFTVTLTQAAA